MAAVSMPVVGTVRQKLPVAVPPGKTSGAEERWSGMDPIRTDRRGGESA